MPSHRTRRSPTWATSGTVDRFLPDPVDEDEIPGEELWDGTIAHIGKMASIVTMRCPYREFEPAERREVAFGEIAMILAEDPDTPCSHVVQSATYAVMRASKEHWRQRGKMDSSDDERLRPAFSAYWLGDRGIADDPPWMDRMAAHQVWDALSDVDQEALLARMSGERTKTIADRLGLSVAAVNLRIKKARERAFAAWFDWEPAPPVPRDRRREKKTHCPHGHDLSVYGSRQKAGTGKDGKRQSVRCLACAREKDRARQATRRRYA